MDSGVLSIGGPRWDQVDTRPSFDAESWTCSAMVAVIARWRRYFRMAREE